MNNKKIGKFYISESFVNQLRYEELSKVFTNVIVVRCEHLEYKNVYEYIALSNKFEETDVFKEIPLYDCIISKQKNGKITVKFSKYQNM